MRMLGKLLLGLAATLLVLAAGAAVYVTTLGRDALVPPVAARVKAATGRELTVAGGARVALALPPRVVLTDIALANAPWASAPTMIEARELDLTVELLPLLQGKVELSRIELVAPRIALETDGAGRANWQFEPAAGASAPPPRMAAPGLPAALVIGNVAVRDGTITYRDGPKATVTTVTVRELALQRRALAGELEVRFAGAVGDLPLDVEGRIGALAALLARQWPYPVDVGGTVAGQKVHFAAKVRADGARYAFDDLAISVGANALRGSLAVEAGGARPRVVFDLAAPVLALAALPASVTLPATAPSAPSTPPARPAGVHLLSDTPVSFAPLRWADADGALAIDRLTLPDGRETGALRVRVSLTDGKLDLRDLSVGLFGGTLAGSITVDAQDPAAAAIVTRLTGSAMSLGAILAAGGHPRELSGGRTDLVANLALRGNSPHAWAASATGTLRLVAGRATITNRKAQALLVWDRLSDAINPFRTRDPSTELQCAVVNLPIANGVARVDRTLAVETSKIGASASGTLDFRNETLDLVFQPKVRKGISIDFAGFSDLVRLQGPFASPQVVVDVAGSAKLIASIGAAVGTGGISAVGQALLSWADGKGPGPCQVALDGGRSASADTAPAPGSVAPAAPVAPLVDSLGKALGKLLGK